MSKTPLAVVDLKSPPSPRLTHRQAESLTGLVMAAPWILGFLFFVAFPMIASLYLAMTRWDIFTSPKFLGMENFEVLLTEDHVFWKSMRVTTLFAVFSVPLQIAVGLGLAQLLNQKIRLLGMFRSIYYLPSVLSGVSIAIMFRWIFGTQYGLLNGTLELLGIEPVSWLGDPNIVLLSFILMSIWGSGANMLIYLGALQSVPTELYEAAEVDGAGSARKFFKITVPMITPVIFFTLINGIIQSLQEFQTPFILTGGGPADSSLFIVLYLYRNAFQWFRMGYASAIAWIIFAYVLVLSLLVMKSSRAWVYYEGSLRGR